MLLARPGALVAGIGAAHVSGRPPAEIRRLLVLAQETDPYVVSRNEGAMLQIVRALYRDDHVARRCMRRRPRSSSPGPTESLVPALGLSAVLRLLAGDEPGAASDARAAIEHPDAASRPLGHIAAAAALAILDARAGRRHSARAHADVALEETRKVGWHGLPAGAPALIADAVTAALEGRLSGAHRSARQAVAAAIAGGLWQAWALLELARIDCQRGRRLVAQDALAHAEELLGAARDAGALPAFASELRRELDAGAPGGSAEPLSPAELAVLRLLPRRTVREMAEALYLSANTIKSHIRAIYRKLGVNSREDAVTRAVTLGLLDDALNPTGQLE